MKTVGLSSTPFVIWEIAGIPVRSRQWIDDHSCRASSGGFQTRPLAKKDWPEIRQLWKMRP